MLKGAYSGIHETKHKALLGLLDYGKNHNHDYFEGLGYIEIKIIETIIFEYEFVFFQHVSQKNVVTENFEISP